MPAVNDRKICVSVCAETVDDLIAKERLAESQADIIELRIDCLPPGDIDVFFERLSATPLGKPLLMTFRSPTQGGRNSASLDERKAFWSKERPDIWAVDVEEDMLAVTRHWPRRIVSFHDLSGDSQGLNAVFEHLLSAATDIVKFVVKTNDVTDSIHLWKLFLLARSQNPNKQIIPIAMGEGGKWTRILGLAYGAYMAYASVAAGYETAEGQITAKDLNEVYRVRELDENTVVYAVIGDPVKRSLSPYMHNPAFAAAGINAVFVPLMVKDLDAFVSRMVNQETREVELNFQGFSVTMPHKRSIMKHLDIVDQAARSIGAVNTVMIDNGRLRGYNTDAEGFAGPLKESFGDLRDVHVGILGAGGASRACVYALKQEGADVTIFARDEQKAAAMAGEFGVRAADISSLREKDGNANGLDVIVNATPVGMKGTLEEASLLTAADLEGVKFVYDLVTSPLDTPLIREAKLAGIPATGGIEMLIAQGAKQFEIWTGTKPDIGLMRSAALAKLNTG